MTAATADPSPRGPRFPWRAFFHRSTAPVFVVAATRRLRYANPAWEALTGRPMTDVRGMRVSARRSASPLGRTLAAPPEVWAGQPATVRRGVPPADAGPPWWDVTFVPLPGPGRPLGVLGVVTVVGGATPRAEAHKVPADTAAVRRDHAGGFSFDLFAGSSPAAERLLNQARLAAQTAAPVWLVGGPGVGKETLARVIHHNGPTREKAFAGVDCEGLPPHLLDGLLFGKGGLAEAGRLGTLYLKDPAALPRDVQDRVAGLFPEPRPAGPRLICGSRRVAADDVSSGRLLPVFHTALSVLEIPVPPLRERIAELPRVADRLLGRFPLPSGDKPRVADGVWRVFRDYDWPGNVRELADVLVRAAGKAADGVIVPDHLPRRLREMHLIASDPIPKPGPAWTLDGVLEAVERRLIDLALRQAGQSQTDAADRLGVPRARLWRRMKALDLPAPPPPQ